jgi:soluble lytic murein transglycosylase-like protein
MTASHRRVPRALAATWRHRSVAVPLLLVADISASASGVSLIRIRPGDTLSALAVRYHTSVAHLVALNHLPGNGDLIYAGQALHVPSGGASAAGGSASHAVVTQYVVRPGDSLDAIAARFHVAPAAIARRNSLPGSLVVMLGQRLSIARTVVTRASGAAPSQGGPGTPAALHDRAVLAGRAEPDQAEVAAMIRSTASRWGLDPRLALAVSWQESGWNMRKVSGVDAIGAMQVMPYTATYLADDVVHRPLDLFSAQDNVTAGVALLSVLMRESHSESRAAAGYYQGLASVESRGMLPDTKQYVADVMALRERY